jgi:L1 cell adhesion molecule like protein
MFGKQKLCHDVHPDEAVALGAGYHAAMLAHDADFQASETLLLLDTVPLNISIETAGGVATVIIPKNSTIPLTQAQTFTTYSDNQTSVTINIFEGNRSMVKDNHMVGSFNLDNIPPAPRGVPQIEVKCEVDNNGILIVTAVDKATSNSQKLTVTNTKGRLSEEEVRRMTEEAQKFEESDKKFLEKTTSRNNYEQSVYSLKNAVNQTQVDKSVKDNILNTLKEHEDWLSLNSDAEKSEYDARMKQVQDLMKNIMPGAAGGFPDGYPGGQPQGPAGGPSVEEVD